MIIIVKNAIKYVNFCNLSRFLTLNFTMLEKKPSFHIFKKIGA